MDRPPYVDPATGQKYDTSNSNFEGWLTKQSAWLKDWRRRSDSGSSWHTCDLI